MAELISYTITIKGRIPAEDRPTAVTEIRKGISLSFPIHESIDELVIHTEGETFNDLKVRFPG